MIWFAILGAAILVAIPLAIMWGLWQLENIDINEIDWREED